MSQRWDYGSHGHIFHLLFPGAHRWTTPTVNHSSWSSIWTSLPMLLLWGKLSSSEFSFSKGLVFYVKLSLPSLVLGICNVPKKLMMFCLLRRASPLNYVCCLLSQVPLESFGGCLEQMSSLRHLTLLLGPQWLCFPQLKFMDFADTNWIFA